MPVFAVIGAAVGASTLGVAGGVLATSIGTTMAGVVGATIGGALGGGVGSVAMGGKFEDGFKQGAIGGLIGGGINAAFGAAGTAAGQAAGAGSQSAMLAEQYAGFAPMEAASHMAGSGLSAEAMVSTLGELGLDYNTAQMYADNALSNTFSPYSMGADNPAVTTHGFNPADISESNISNNRFMSNQDMAISEQFNALSEPSTFAPSPDKWWTGEGLPTDYGLENIFQTTADKATTDAWPGGYNLNEGVPYEVGKPMGSLEAATAAPTASLESGAPIVEATGAKPGLNNAQWGNNTVPTNLNTLFSGAKGIMKDLMPKGMDMAQLGMAGMQTYSDMQNAKKLQQMADEAGAPYRAYMDTFSNPDKYWNEYMQGQGAIEYNKGSRQMAKAGRTGTLPSLYTQGHQNYMANALPQIRQGLATGGTMASNNMQQQMYPMAMKQRALSYIPSVMTTNKLMNLYASKK